MTQPCDKTEIITVMSSDLKEVKSDVKTLLAIHNQRIGESKFKRRMFKMALESVKIVVTVIVTIFSYGKMK